MDTFFIFTNFFVICMTFYSMNRLYINRLVQNIYKNESKYDALNEKFDCLDICMNLKMKNLKKKSGIISKLIKNILNTILINVKCLIFVIVFIF